MTAYMPACLSVSHSYRPLHEDSCGCRPFRKCMSWKQVRNSSESHSQLGIPSSHYIRDGAMVRGDFEFIWEQGFVLLMLGESRSET